MTIQYAISKVVYKYLSLYLCPTVLNSFNINATHVQDRIIELDDIHLSVSVEYLYKCASKELITFKDNKFLEKHTVEKDGFLYSKNCLEETAKLRSVGHLSDFINIETFWVIPGSKL